MSAWNERSSYEVIGPTALSGIAQSTRKWYKQRASNLWPRVAPPRARVREQSKIRDAVLPIQARLTGTQYSTRGTLLYLARHKAA